MKKFYKLSLLPVLAAIILASFSGFKSNPDSTLPPNGGGEYIFDNTSCITDEERTEIQLQINKNIADLKQRGIIHEADASSVTLFSWPLRKAANLTDPGYYGISNYIDEDNTTGLKDYNCGQRTYDGHKGTDIFTWPFGWYKMDNNQVEVIAAAPGVIIYKHDGEFDRSCTFNNNIWNAIYVRHADGSVAWYGHMKKNSLTSKIVGDSVVTGEFLGVVGSAGNSTGPHLHFEVYNPSNVLIDPWQGSCNGHNSESWWQMQKPYNEPKINALLTHKKDPVFPTCNAQETLYVKNNFNRGDSIYFIPYYADQQAGMVTQYSVLKPDNSVWSSWSHSSPTSYVASYWWWTNRIPTDAPLGTWKFRAVFNSVTYEKTFVVGTTGIENVSSEIPEKYSLQQNYPNPFNPETKIRFSIPLEGNNTVTKLSVYDISGKEIRVLVNENLKAGSYDYSFDASDLSTGIYFYTIRTESFIETKRMVLIK